MRLLDVKVGDLRLIRMDDWGLGLGCGWFEINYHTWCRVMGFVVCWLGGLIRGGFTRFRLGFRSLVYHLVSMNRWVSGRRCGWRL